MGPYTLFVFVTVTCCYPPSAFNGALNVLHVGPTFFDCHFRLEEEEESGGGIPLGQMRTTLLRR